MCLCGCVVHPESCQCDVKDPSRRAADREQKPIRFINKTVCITAEDIFPYAGLDYEELERMDPVMRRGVLTEAGLDPDEFAF